MLIPTYFIKEIVNQEFTRRALTDPERFKSFYSNDHLILSPFSNSDNSTWQEYSFTSVDTTDPNNINGNDIVGTMIFPITRPDKHISGIGISLLKKSKRRIFYNDLMECLKVIYANNHPSLKFQTMENTDAYKIYEKLVKQGYLIKYEVPFSWTTALGKREYWHHYAMNKEMLGKFIGESS